MSYNTTSLNNLTSVFDIMSGVNTASGGYFFTALYYLMLLGVFIMFSQTTLDIKKAFLGTSAIGVFVGALMWQAGLLSLTNISIMASILCVSILIKFLAKD